MDKNWCYCLLAGILVIWSEAAVAKEPDVGQVSSDTTAEVKFLNPIFYETLHSYSLNSNDERLTPTKIFVDTDGYNGDEDCELIKNTWKSIILKCDTTFDLGERGSNRFQQVYVFTIEPCLRSEGCYDGRFVVKEEGFPLWAWENFVKKRKPQTSSLSYFWIE